MGQRPGRASTGYSWPVRHPLTPHSTRDTHTRHTYTHSTHMAHVHTHTSDHGPGPHLSRMPLTGFPSVASATVRSPKQQAGHQSRRDRPSRDAAQTCPHVSQAWTAHSTSALLSLPPSCNHLTSSLSLASQRQWPAGHCGLRRSLPCIWRPSLFSALQGVNSALPSRPHAAFSKPQPSQPCARF